MFCPKALIDIAIAPNSKIIFYNNGDVAQLARALDWQSRGREFESHLLHIC